MPNLQQSAADGTTRSDKPRQDLVHLMDSPVDEAFARAADSDSLINLADLLGLNMPRGQLVGESLPNSSSSVHPVGTPPRPGTQQYHHSSRSYTWDDSGFSPTRCSTPVRGVTGVTPLEMSTPRRSGGIPQRGRLDSVGTYGPLSPSSSSSPLSQFSSSLPSNVGTPRGIRSSPSFSESVFRSSASRSNSPESDTSGASSLDGGNLSELMSCLSLNPTMLPHSISSSGYAGLQNTCGSPEQNELTNLANLHALQTISNNTATMKYYQRRSELQQRNQSPYGSPVNSPLPSPEKPWGVSALPGSPVGVLPNPLMGLAPGTPPSPGLPSPSVGGLTSRLNHSASVSADALDPSCTWNGDLPPKSFENPTFSVKVFLGGVPWDINEAMLINAFKHIGPIRVEWPSSKNQTVSQTKGYAYIIFECEKQVKSLLQCCFSKYVGGPGNWYYKISSKRMKGKDVQVIPWLIGDANWVRSPSQKLDPEKTVFVGGLHGMLNAQGLAQIMNDLFGGVVYAGIDTDKFKYPIGSARVTFNNFFSFLKAVKAGFIEILTPNFRKRVQVDPYLEDSPCSVCRVQQGPYFCRTETCFRYFCRSCWTWYHSVDIALNTHCPLMRTSKTTGASTVVSESSMGLGMGGLGMSMGLMRFRGGIQRE